MPLKFKCPSCSNEIVTRYLSPGQMTKCQNCGVDVQVPPDAQIMDREETAAYYDEVRHEKRIDIPAVQKENKGRALAKGMRVFAWIILIGGTLAGIIMFISGIALSAEGYHQGTPLWALSLYVMGISIGTGIFYFVIALMAECIFDIRAKIVELTE